MGDDTIIPSQNFTDEHIGILYLTFGLMAMIFVIWLILVWMTNEDPVAVLNAMNNATGQIEPVTDTVE